MDWVLGAANEVDESDESVAFRMNVGYRNLVFIVSTIRFRRVADPELDVRRLGDVARCGISSLLLTREFLVTTWALNGEHRILRLLLFLSLDAQETIQAQDYSS